MTGIGVVEGRECVVVANDATVKGGTYYPVTVRKHLRAQEGGEPKRLPRPYPADPGGALPPTNAEAPPRRDHFRRSPHTHATSPAKGSPQNAADARPATALPFAAPGRVAIATCAAIAPEFFPNPTKSG